MAGLAALVERFPEITSGAVGAGGMGEVYRVRGARLAVKILPKHVAIVPIRNKVGRKRCGVRDGTVGSYPPSGRYEITHLPMTASVPKKSASLQGCTPIGPS